MRPTRLSHRLRRRIEWRKAEASPWWLLMTRLGRVDTHVHVRLYASAVYPGEACNA